MDVPFNRPRIGGAELEYVRQALESGRVSGDSAFTERCQTVLQSVYGGTVLLMHSCTAALEAAVILAGIEPGDEVIMPSFTFVSTANAVVMRGAVPVFVDIRPDTLNIDEAAIERAITSRTKAIMPVHYAGVGASMTTICEIAAQRGLTVIEDAAQGFGATFEGKPLGAIGDMGCLSFHETKNIVSGEGGALIVNDPALVERAQFIREKGTNRTKFQRREISKYEWVDIGSSYLPSDILAAVLLAQLEVGDEITDRRREIWGHYDKGLQKITASGAFRSPAVPLAAKHNGHIFYLLAETPDLQADMIRGLREDGIAASSHYVPLHNSPAGLRYARAAGSLEVTERSASCLLRLPLHATLTDDQVNYTIERTLARAEQALAA